MQKLKRIILMAFLALVALAVLLFTLENRHFVHITLMGWQSPRLPMALYVLVVFVLGMIAGFALNWLRNKCLEHTCRKQAKQLEKLKAEQQKQSAAVEGEQAVV